MIAVDGPVAAGKGTLARRLAAALSFAHLDTGMLYRAVAARMLEEGRDLDDPAAAAATARAIVPRDLDRPDLRQEAVSQGSSKVAVQPAVRAALLAFQRHFAAHPPGAEAGAVLDGRDIGTVVCPEAQVKFFVTAGPEARAMRRFKELRERGEESIYARVLRDLQERDARDAGRKTAPLKAADDAIILDTTDMSIEEAVEKALAVVEARSPR